MAVATAPRDCSTDEIYDAAGTPTETVAATEFEAGDDGVAVDPTRSPEASEEIIDPIPARPVGDALVARPGSAEYMLEAVNTSSPREDELVESGARQSETALASFCKASTATSSRSPSIEMSPLMVIPSTISSSVEFAMESESRRACRFVGAAEEPASNKAAAAMLA